MLTVSPTEGYPTKKGVSLAWNETVNNGEAQFLEISEVWSSHSLTLLSDPLWFSAVVPFRVSSLGQIDMFKNIHIRLNRGEKTLWRNNYKKM